VKSALLIFAACSADHVVGAASPDARAAMPDLAIIPSTHMAVETLYFPPGACEIVEGCVGGAGNRRLLRFDATIANLGGADLVLGAAPPAGVSGGAFVWSACHMHHHVPGFADYALVDDDGEILSAHKQAFCLRDDLRVGTSESHGFDCTNQGISAGWADLYQAQLPCQWIDITDVDPGLYTLRITVNPSGAFPDADRANDALDTPIAF